MTLATLKTRLSANLWPVDKSCITFEGSASDFDLNPQAERAADELRPAAVLVAIVARDGGASVLLTRRADTLAKHTGQIAFPGGRLDPGETIVEAALREAMEEVALPPTAVEVLKLGGRYETVTGFVVTPVVGWVEDLPPLTPSDGEVADIFEVPWDFLMDPANHRKDFYDPDEGDRRWFWAMPFEDRYIWGATAGMLKGLYRRLYGDEADADRAVIEDAA